MDLAVCRFVGLLVALLTVTPVLRYWVSSLSTGCGTESGNTPIVPGQDVIAPDMLGIGSCWRSFYAVLVWRENHFCRIVVSGKGAVPLMRDLMTVENAATSTRENALFVRRVLASGDGSYVLLTSDYHMNRALRTFRRAGIAASPLPFPDAGKRCTTSHNAGAYASFWRVKPRRPHITEFAGGRD
jgi:uncharacterized SAM-binding protein YcdF (DUF218 family)